VRLRSKRWATDKTRQTLDEEGDRIFVCRCCEAVSRVGFVDLVRRNASTFCPECGEADMFPLDESASQ